MRLLQRHFHRLTPLMPLDAEASGLMVLTQDGRVWRRLSEDRDDIEQEFVVEVDGEIAPYGLQRLSHGLSYGGRALPPCKVSWQSEIRLRFAIKGVQGGQLRDMCAQVGLDVVAIRRLRIGRVALAKMPEGAWRYLRPPSARCATPCPPAPDAPLPGRNLPAAPTRSARWCRTRPPGGLRCRR